MSLSKNQLSKYGSPIKKIGKGNYGSVKYYQLDGQDYAIKKVEYYYTDYAEISNTALRETAILKRIDHPNVLFLYEAIINNNKLYLVTEYMHSGDLHDYIHSSIFNPNKEAKKIVYQLL